MRIAVVTPTIGSEHLQQCIESVQNQLFGDVVHYLFIDGEENFEKAQHHIDAVSIKKQINLIKVQENIGKGWYGHRVYAASSFLVNADAICYLDEDNWYDENHVQTIADKLNDGNNWTYSLRKIYDKAGQFLFEDNCESLGKWPVYFNEKVFHVDTSSFGVWRDVATAVGHTWYGQWGADRKFFSALSRYFPKFDCTNQYTLNYRLEGNEGSVTPDFFEKGNLIYSTKYNGDYPWKK